MQLLLDDVGYKVAFDAFELILQDVSRTPGGWCPVCGFGLLHYLRDGSASLRALQREHHGFWDACVRQIVAKSRPADVEAELRAQLQANMDSCPSVGAYHDDMLKMWAKDYITDPLMLFRALICLCLARCLYGSDTASDNQSRVFLRARDPRKRFRSSDDLWPRHPDQLLPHGPGQTVCALVLACLSWNDDGPWYILNAVVQIARPRVIGALTEVELFATRLSLRCLEIIFHGTAYSIQGHDRGTPLGEPRILAIPDTPWLRSGAGRRVVAAFLRTLWDGPYARPDEMYRFLSYRMHAFRTSYGAAAEESAATGSDVWKSIVLALHPAAPHVQEARTLVPDSLVVLRIEQKPRSYAVLMTVWLAWRSLHSDKRCSAPDCTRTMLDEDSDRPPLPTCAQCRVVRYCSAACQRSDWRGGKGIAHKSVCGILAVLQSIAGSITTQGEYATAVRSSSISDRELALVGLWAASRSQHYMDLIRTEMAFPDLFSAVASD